jgi:hypothetical protein
MRPKNDFCWLTAKKAHKGLLNTCISLAHNTCRDMENIVFFKTTKGEGEEGGDYL